MLAPVLLLLISLGGILAALTLQGMSDLLLVAAPSLLAALFLLARGYLHSRQPAEKRPGRTFAGKRSKDLIVIDGSNAMHWKDNTPQIATLRDIVEHLSKLGFTPGVIFDANAGYALTGKYQHNAAMGKLLDLPEDRVIVVDKGTPADPTILAAARFLGARIVTNDRYTDWAAAHPELNDPDHLIRGGYRDGKLWLAVDPDKT